MSQIAFEPAQPADSAQIIELLKSCDLPTEDLIEDWTGRFRVSRNDDAVVGAIGLDRFDRIALVRSLAVAPSSRGQGIASKLLSDIEQHARALGIDTQYGLTTTIETFLIERDYTPVPRDDAPTPIQETAEFRELCPDSAALVMKDLRSL
jgi:N-acetylglutamate synthase-like GNAT family acetyltransferase